MTTYWAEQFGNGANYVTTFNVIALGFGMFFAGKLHMKSGTRVSYQRGAVIQAAAIVILYFAQNIQMVWLYSFLTGISSSFIYSPGLTNAQNWFPHKRGLVTGIVNLTFGCSGAIMAPIMNRLLSAYGNQTMLIVLCVCTVIFQFGGSLLSEMPERAKMSGAQKAAHEQLLAELASKGGKGPSSSMTTAKALRTKQFWALSDMIGRRTLGSISFLVGAAGYLMLPRVNTLLPLCICTACVGYAFGTLFAISGPLTTDLFGLKYFGTIFGMVFTAYGFVGGLLGPMAAAAVLTAFGSYVPVFTYLAVFCVMAAVCILFAKDKEG